MATSESLFRLRLRKFRRLKRGYYSFMLLVGLYFISLFNGCLVNNKALVVRYQGSYYFPILAYHDGAEFGQTQSRGAKHFGEADYRELRQQFREAGEGNWVLMPPYPYHPNESLLHIEGNPPHYPSWEHWMGTDNRGRDLFARVVYGFRISMNFAVFVTGLSYALGTIVGAVLAYYGGRIDLYSQRLIEIWMTVPFLYTVIILSSIMRPNFMMLAFLLLIFGWMGISYYIRGEVYREKARDYVAATRAIGERDFVIIFRHILPNAITPIVSLFPFAIVGNITSLVALDYLGFGMAPPTPSWGELLRQGHEYIFAWHLVLFPFLALFFTLQLTVFIGEAVREAFDPKVFSRLR